MILRSSPWGDVQRCVPVTDGILRVSTASHGGFKLCLDYQRRMPAFLAPTFDGGWYEEDCDWAKVAVVFPQFFSPATVSDAVRSIKYWQKDNARALAYVATGDAARIAADYDLAHANEWTVISMGTPPAGHEGWLVGLAHRTHRDQLRRGVMAEYPRKQDWTDAELQAEMIELPIPA